METPKSQPSNPQPKVQSKFFRIALVVFLSAIPVIAVFYLTFSIANPTSSIRVGILKKVFCPLQGKSFSPSIAACSKLAPDAGVACKQNSECTTKICDPTGKLIFSRLRPVVVLKEPLVSTDGYILGSCHRWISYKYDYQKCRRSLKRPVFRSDLDQAAFIIEPDTICEHHYYDYETY
ncbi:MAG: hypothetical protein AAB515_04015 [Patescibacteria group bacterium]